MDQHAVPFTSVSEPAASPAALSNQEAEPAAPCVYGQDEERAGQNGFHRVNLWIYAAYEDTLPWS